MLSLASMGGSGPDVASLEIAEESIGSVPLSPLFLVLCTLHIICLTGGSKAKRGVSRFTRAYKQQQRSDNLAVVEELKYTSSKRSGE